MNNMIYDRMYSMFQCFIEYSLKNNLFDSKDFISYCNEFDIRNSEKIFSRDESAAQSINHEMHPNGSQATLQLATIAGIHENSYVLDAGCGHGGASRILATNYPEAKFIGIDKDHLRVIDSIFRTKKTNINNLEYRQDDAYNMSFDDETFDTIIRQHSVYGGDERIFLSECYRVLKPKGRIAFQGVLCMKSFKKEKMYMDDYSYTEYCKLLSDSGFKILKVETEDSTKELMESVEKTNRSYFELVKNGILIGIKLVAEKSE